MTPMQTKLAGARAWSRAQVDTVFDELGDHALPFFSDVLAKRALVGSRDAYACLDPLLQRLLETQIDISPLVPLLESLVIFPGYDPDGQRQYERARILALRLLSRRKSPAAGAWIDRFIADFPVDRGLEYAASLAHQLSIAALDLGNPGRAPALRALLDSLLPEHSKVQRKRALGESHDLVARLAAMQV